MSVEPAPVERPLDEKGRVVPNLPDPDRRTWWWSRWNDSRDGEQHALRVHVGYLGR